MQQSTSAKRAPSARTFLNFSGSTALGMRSATKLELPKSSGPSEPNRMLSSLRFSMARFPPLVLSALPLISFFLGASSDFAACTFWKSDSFSCFLIIALCSIGARLDPPPRGNCTSLDNGVRSFAFLHPPAEWCHHDKSCFRARIPSASLLTSFSPHQHQAPRYSWPSSSLSFRSSPSRETWTADPFLSSSAWRSASCCLERLRELFTCALNTQF